MNRRQKREIVKEEKCCREVCPWTPGGLCDALVAVAPVDESLWGVVLCYGVGSQCEETGHSWDNVPREIGVDPLSHSLTFSFCGLSQGQSGQPLVLSQSLQFVFTVISHLWVHNRMQSAVFMYCGPGYLGSSLYRLVKCQDEWNVSIVLELWDSGWCMVQSFFFFWTWDHSNNVLFRTSSLELAKVLFMRKTTELWCSYRKCYFEYGSQQFPNSIPHNFISFVFMQDTILIIIIVIVATTTNIMFYYCCCFC